MASTISITYEFTKKNRFFPVKNYYFCSPFAGVAKLADASDLGSDAARYVGSTPITRTFFILDFFSGKKLNKPNYGNSDKGKHRSVER
jgi:hypothetical protein